MPHPTEQYGQIVVVSLVYWIFRGCAWAETGLRLKPMPLAARAAPEIFKKPLLVTSMTMRSFLDHIAMNSSAHPYPDSMAKNRPRYPTLLRWSSTRRYASEGFLILRTDGELQ
jgi:hypothetical protein